MNGNVPAPQPNAGQRLETWLEANLDLVALAAVALGLLLRLKAGIGTYLNPDEATNYLIARQASLGAVYRASLTSPHPPLYFFLLYLWRLLGSSEFMLRLPSILAGTAFLWVAYRWVAETMGRVAGLATVLVLAFSPLLISLSAEVRSYALLMLLTAGALWTLERAFRRSSRSYLLLSAALLYLAILTHYSAIVLAIALGIYGLVRVLRREMPANASGAWVAVQAIAAGLCIVLYVTHLSHLKGSGLERSASDIWLRASYFHRGESSLLLFPLQATGYLFRYLFDSRLLGISGALLALAGVILLVVKPAAPARRLTALLLVLPFLVAIGFALAGVYPYGGTRHNVFLILFATAVIGAVIERIVRGRMVVLLVGAVVILPLWNLTAPKPSYRIPDQRRQVMQSGVSYVRQTVAPGSFIFCDFQTSQLLAYYLDPKAITEVPSAVTELGSGAQFLEYRYSGYRVVTEVKSWSFTADDFADELARFRESFRVPEETSVWVVDAGWGPAVVSEQSHSFPDFESGRVKTFGANIAVFAARPRTSAENVSALTELAQEMSGRSGLPARTVLLPSDVPGLESALSEQRLGRQVLTYARFYQALASGQSRPADYLPALAFWQFNTREQHVQGFSYMNERESFEAGGYRFTLLALSRDSSAAVYLIELGR